MPCNKRIPVCVSFPRLHILTHILQTSATFIFMYSFLRFTFHVLQWIFRTHLELLYPLQQIISTPYHPIAIGWLYNVFISLFTWFKETIPSTLPNCQLKTFFFRFITYHKTFKLKFTSTPFNPRLLKYLSIMLYIYNNHACICLIQLLIYFRLSNAETNFIVN